LYGANLTFAIAFSAGVASFLSPCVLPLIPTYLTYLTGASVEQLTDEQQLRLVRGSVMVNALAFVLGFSGVFVLFGLGASAVGQILVGYQRVIQRLSGALIIFFGMHMIGIFRVGFLQQTRRVQVELKGGKGVLTSLALGALFSAGWTPCIGPVLGSILTMAASGETLYAGAYLLAAYSLGLAVPFLLSAASLGWFMRFLSRFRHQLPRVEFASGLLLILIGVMVFQDYLWVITQCLGWVL